MKASDYIVKFLISKGISDVFGYPGGMVTHLMDSFLKYKISAHLTYHEQAAAFAACGYAQTSGRPGVAYATSGPGATNLITGICNAYFDSLPTIFITGQVNISESKKGYGVRQRGFQETDIVSIVRPVTKYSVRVEEPEALSGELEKAYRIAMSERKGPVLIDIPMNIFRADIKNLPVKINAGIPESRNNIASISGVLSEALLKSNSPIFILGAGIKSAGLEEKAREIFSRLKIPVVSSMLAFDVMKNCSNYYGFIGAYGSRTANFVTAKSDLIISLGSRLDIRQVGFYREKFAPEAKIIRFDIDKNELDYHVHENENAFCVDLGTALAAIGAVRVGKSYSPWISICDEIRSLLSDFDKTEISSLIRDISEKIPDDSIITTDVGQNQVWIAQYFKIKSKQRVLFSGGLGAMGYSLPAAIGAFYGSNKKNIYCFTGDGGMQMNIQELQFIARENLPVKIFVLNNNSLGMIRQFQEMYFDSRYFQTNPRGGYTAPNFAKIASAYGIFSRRVNLDELQEIQWHDGPGLLEIMLQEDTYIIPKLEFGKPNQDQAPLIDRALYNRIMAMTIRGGGVPES